MALQSCWTGMLFGMGCMWLPVATTPRYRYSMVQFVPLDARDEDSIAEVLGQVDMAIQYGEDAEVKVPRDADDGEEDD